MKETFFLAILSGILLFLSFPRFDLGFLAWVALVPLLYAIEDRSVRDSFWLGWLAGIVFFFGGVSWVTNTMVNYGGLSLPLSYLILLLLVLYLGLYYAAFSSLLTFIRSKTRVPLIIIAPPLWVSLELLRNYLLTGSPWLLLGYSQYRYLSIIQIADITGVYGVSFIIVLVNTLLFELIDLYLIKERSDRKFPLRTVITASAIMVAILLYSHWRLSNLKFPISNFQSSIKVSLIQGNIPQEIKWDKAYERSTIDTYIRLTKEATRREAYMVVWPEAATPFYLEQEKMYLEMIANLLREKKVYLLVGSPSYDLYNKKVRLYNSAYLLNPEGRIVSRYDKIHLVPFGEYVPLRRILFFIEKMVVGIGDFSSGEEYTVMELPEGRFGVVICFEVIFPELVREFVKRGANFIATITNDAWFGRSSAPYQHFSMAVFRAVENRVPIIRAANTGVSGIIDQTGRIIKASDIFVEAYISGEITPATNRSLYTRFGDLFSYICAVFTLIIVGMSLRK